MSDATARSTPSRRRRIVLATVGSAGDLNPYLALALGLRARGHDAVVATSACHRPKVDALGLGFAALRPDSAFATDPAAMRRFMHERWGTVRIGREVVLPALRQTYDDLASASAGADLLVSHPLVNYAARLVGETAGVPWASTMVTPLCFLSAHDVPILPVSPKACRAVRLLPPVVSGPFLNVFKRASRWIARPADRLRADLGLPRAREPNPLIDSHSPRLALALFSPVLADRQPDSPPATVVTGFPIFDREPGGDGGGDGERGGPGGLPVALSAFLGAGPPPVVFTLSCSAGMVAGRFFETSAAVAVRAGYRAVLVVGRDAGLPPAAWPDGVVAHAYAPFSALFPRAAAVVHAGGIGTTGLVMRAGRPSLVVPHAHDQPDNAARLARLGAARTIAPRCYTESRVVAELRHLLGDPAYARRAADVGEQVRQEDGVGAACDALEEMLDLSSRPRETGAIRISDDSYATAVPVPSPGTPGEG